MKARKTHYIPMIKQMAFLFLSFMLAATLVVTISLRAFVRSQNKYMQNTLVSYSVEVIKSATAAYENYENICYSIAYDPTVQNFLCASTRTEQYAAYQQLAEQLSKMSHLNSYIYDIAVYGDSGSFASLLGAREDYTSLYEIYEKENFSYRAIGVQSITSTSCHILAMPICSTETDSQSTAHGEFLGVLFLAVDIDSLLRNTIQTASDFDPQILFLSDDGQLVYGDRKLFDNFSTVKAQGVSDDAIHLFHTGGTSYAYISYEIPNISHTLYLLTDLAPLKKRIQVMIIQYLMLMLAAVVFVVLFLMLLYRPLYRSLRQMTKFMNEVSGGNQRRAKEGLYLKEGRIATTEIRDIAGAFNHLLRESDAQNHRIFNTYTRMYELEEENRRAEVAFLRSQVNPHFLYNTLTMICGMAADGNTDRIIDVTSALSRIFRYSIKGTDIVPLREEMKIIKSYLFIQRERFGNRFVVRYEIDPDDLDFPIPKMILQPLVENAIVHGLEQASGGELLIGAEHRTDMDCLSLYVYDTGKGMDPKTLEKLQKAILAQSERQHRAEGESYDHIGILNVSSRLVLTYGKEYALHIDSEKNVGTNIEIRIPDLSDRKAGTNVSSNRN